MANNLSEMVNVNIDVARPAGDSASFDSLLIVGPPPSVTPVVPLPVVGVYSGLEEVSEAGYVTSGENADPIGAAARIAFSQSPKPSRIFIAVQVKDEDVTEPAVETLMRALDTSGWYVICPAGIDESEFEPIAAWAETQTKQFAYTFLSQTDPISETYYRSQGWCGLTMDNQNAADVPESNRYLHVGAVAKALSYPAGSETWAFKSLAGIAPSSLSGTLKKALTDGHSNYFAQYAGRNISMNGQMRAGEWIDVIRGRDWLENDMKLRIFNLFITNPKILYTNAGIALVETQMIASLKAAQTRGIVAQSEYDEDGNLVPGFTTSMPNALSLTATQRASRVLTDCKFTARLAGAIHMVDIRGNLTH